MNSKLCVFISGNLLWLYAFVFIVTVVNASWISDDALITMRHVLNFINGYGPVFNVGERVQAYTHPLWFLLISLFSYFFSGHQEGTIRGGARRNAKPEFW